MFMKMTSILYTGVWLHSNYVDESEKGQDQRNDTV